MANQGDHARSVEELIAKIYQTVRMNFEIRG
jgi:hypothetical protein